MRLVGVGGTYSESGHLYKQNQLILCNRELQKYSNFADVTFRWSPREKWAEICKQSPLQFTPDILIPRAVPPPISCSITKNVIHDSAAASLFSSAKWRVPVHFELLSRIMLEHILLLFAVAMFWSCFGFRGCHSHRRKIGLDVAGSYKIHLYGDLKWGVSVYDVQWVSSPSPDIRNECPLSNGKPHPLPSSIVQQVHLRACGACASPK